MWEAGELGDEDDEEEPVLYTVPSEPLEGEAPIEPVAPASIASVPVPSREDVANLLLQRKKQVCSSAFYSFFFS